MHAASFIKQTGGWGPAQLIRILLISMGKQEAKLCHTADSLSMKFPPYVYPFLPLAYHNTVAS